MGAEFELFKGTNFSDLMRDVYHNSKKKSRQIDTLIKSLDSRILSESELIEIFQNHNLNVNISQNKKLLSKVKKEYETQKLNNKKSFSLSKIVSLVILIISLGSIFKIFS